MRHLPLTKSIHSRKHSADLTCLSASELCRRKSESELRQFMHALLEFVKDNGTELESLETPSSSAPVRDWQKSLLPSD